MAKEAAVRDDFLEVEDTEEGDDKKKRRIGLTVDSLYEAVASLVAAREHLSDRIREHDGKPPVVLITGVAGEMKVFLCEGDFGEAIYEAVAVGAGVDTDEAFCTLLEELQKTIEEQRRAKFSGIDEYLKKSNSVLRRLKSKKKDPG